MTAGDIVSGSRHEVPDTLIAPAAAPTKSTRRKYQRLPRPERQRLRRAAATAYTRGDSIRAVAAAIGYSYATTHRILTDAGVALRRRGGPHLHRHNGEASTAAPSRQGASR